MSNREHPPSWTTACPCSRHRQHHQQPHCHLPRLLVTLLIRFQWSGLAVSIKTTHSSIHTVQKMKMWNEKLPAFLLNTAPYLSIPCLLLIQKLVPGAAELDLMPGLLEFNLGCKNPKQKRIQNPLASPSLLPAQPWLSEFHKSMPGRLSSLSCLVSK